jgi:hypothetical protein
MMTTMPLGMGERRQVLLAPATFPLLAIHVAAIGAVAVLVYWAIAAGLYEAGDSHDAIAIVSGAMIVALAVYVRIGLQYPWSSASLVYLGLFAIFHCGMVTTAVLVPSVLAPFEDWELEWLGWPNVRLAMLLSVLGAAGFVLGAGFVRIRQTGTGLHPDGETEDPVLVGAGWLLLLIGLLWTAVILALAGGPAVVGMSYLEFRREVLGPSRLQSAMDLAQVGCLFALAGGARPGPGRHPWTSPLLLWTLFGGAPMLLLGLRGEALIPFVSFMVVLAHRGRRIRTSTAMIGVLAVSVLIPAVQAVRTVGVTNRDLVSWTEVTPLDTLTELGGTLRAVKAYVDWIEEGDPLLYGESYWAPVDRQLLTRLPPVRERIAYENDPRIPLRLMDVREGAVGGAAVGEAYYNFGAIGPLLVLMPIGALFGWLDRRAHESPYRCALVGLAMLVFIPNIRGDWLAIPAQAVMMGALLAVCYGLRRLIP